VTIQIYPKNMEIYILYIYIYIYVYVYVYIQKEREEKNKNTDFAARHIDTHPDDSISSIHIFPPFLSRGDFSSAIGLDSINVESMKLLCRIIENAHKYFKFVFIKCT